MSKLKQVFHLSIICLVFLAIHGTAKAQVSVQQARQVPIGRIVTVEGTVSRGWGQSLYIQDETAGIEITQSEGILAQLLLTQEIVPGNTIRVTGRKQEQNGQQQIVLANGDFNPSSRVEVLDRRKRSPKPIVLTYREFVTNPQAYESRCVFIKDLKTASTGVFSAGSIYTVTVEDMPAQTLRLSIPQDKSNVGLPPALSIPTGNFAFEGIVLRSADQFYLSATLKRDIYQPFVLTLIHNNDGESKLIEAGSTPTLLEFGGVSRFKTKLDQLKNAAQASGSAVLTLSSGDNFLAGAVFNANLQLPADQPFYDAVAMETFGYDAICIGNHDLDFGPDVLARFISGFRSPNNVFLSANLDFSNEPELLRLQQEGRIAPYRVVTVNGEKVGIIGLTTPLLRSISTPRNIIIDQNVSAAVQREVDRMESAGINKIVLISHMQTLDADYELCQSLRGVDVVIAGGSDATLANDSDHLIPGDVIQGSYPLYITDRDSIEVPNVTTGGDYKYIGNLVTWFNPVGEVVWVDAKSSRPHRVASFNYPDGVQRDRDLVRLIDEPVRNYISTLASRVIAVTEDSLDGRRTSVRLQETGLGNLFADAILWQARQLAPAFGIERVDLALQNGGGIRNNSQYPAGHQLTELNTFDIAAFSNFVGVVRELTPLEVRRLVEHGVARLPLEGGQYCQIAGMRVEIDLNEPAIQYNTTDGRLIREGSRVRNLILENGTYVVHNGVVQPIGNLNVATIDFLARNSGNNLGGDNYPFRSEAFVPMGRTYQQALFNYLTEGLGGRVSKIEYPHQDRGWRRMVRVAKAQVIHNAPDPALETVDVFINNRMVINDFDFRSATPYIYVPCDQEALISFSTDIRANNPSTSAIRVPFKFHSQKTYQVTATGVLSPALFAPNPEGRSTNFRLEVLDNASASTEQPGIAKVLFVHGSPDGPTFRVRIRDGNRYELTDLSYTSRQGPVGLVDAPTFIDLALSDGSLFGTWSLTPFPIIGESALVIASGFVNPEINGQGRPFQLIMVRPNGDTYPLIRMGTQQKTPMASSSVQALIRSHNGEVIIDREQPCPCQFSLDLYNLAGQHVASHRFNGLESGSTHIDVTNLPVGFYVYQLNTNCDRPLRGKLLINR